MSILKEKELLLIIFSWDLRSLSAAHSDSEILALSQADFRPTISPSRTVKLH